MYGVNELTGSGPVLDFKFTPVKKGRVSGQDFITFSSAEFYDGITYEIKPVNWIVSSNVVPTSYELLQNYPNPFNPETWIPFSLPQSSDVFIKIYDMSGQIIRSLDLGRKPAGFHFTKDKAAYWDGKNRQGESVASGIYFYQLQTSKFSVVKKMVILK
jgi:hypothetical protein